MAFRSDWSLSDTGPPVLIEVPRLALVVRPRPGLPRPRRLRREVRMGGIALLVGLPALGFGWGLGTLQHAPVSQAGLIERLLGADPEPPAVSLSEAIEPIAVGSMAREDDAPIEVQTSGELIPAVSAIMEDTGHAGR
jgi:hypothetical protein